MIRTDTSAHFHFRQITGAREEQQDFVHNLIVSEKLSLYILADGMGGHQSGKLAAKTAANAFANHIDVHGIGHSPENDLRQALEHANAAIAKTTAHDPASEGMGTTLLALLLNEQNGHFWFISVGDSPLYLFNGNSLQRINANHAFAADLEKLVAIGQMSREEAQNHPARHAVTSAVMGKNIPKTDVQSGELNIGETLILASDGLQTLSDTPNGEITSILSANNHLSVEKTTAALLHAVAQKHYPRQDNASVIIVRRPDNSATTPTRHINAPATAPTTHKHTTQSHRPKNDDILTPMLAGMATAGVIALCVAAGYLFLSKKPPKPPVPSTTTAVPQLTPISTSSPTTDVTSMASDTSVTTPSIENTPTTASSASTTSQPQSFDQQKHTQH